MNSPGSGALAGAGRVILSLFSRQEDVNGEHMRGGSTVDVAGGQPDCIKAPRSLFSIRAMLKQAMER